MSDRPAVFVTGGAGYIGAHCCRALDQAGFVPVTFDNLTTGHRHFVKWGPLVVGDIRDTDQVAATLQAHRAVAVMHFAASNLVGESTVDPEKYYANNVGGTLSLLKAMRQASCARLVFSSTGAVYGDADARPIREDAICSPVNPYGRSKWMIEQILTDYHHAYDLRSMRLRYFNASGASLSGEIGESHDPETHLIPRALMALLGHVGDFSVFGDDYETPDGTAIRDYIHVDDLAQAHILALRALLDDHKGGVFNLGTGAGYSVRDILSAILKVTGQTVPAALKPRRAGDPAILVADAGAARQVLGFVPQHSTIESIVTSAWAWHQKTHPRKAGEGAAG